MAGYKKNGDRMDTMGMRLAHLRESRNLSQAELAEQIGYSRSMIQKWEKDEHCPKSDVICDYAIMFEVSADWILFGERKGLYGIHGERSTEVPQANVD
jgi:transcriptional regulator with XRE-family HTH domain